MNHDTFAARYRQGMAAAGGCPIEAGTMLRLADNECRHGRLPLDRSAPCGCWVDIEGAQVVQMPAVDRAAAAGAAAA